MKQAEQKIATIEQPSNLPAPITPMQMLQIAVEQGADLDKLSKLMDLQERWEANEARKSFVAALNEFKANPPDLIRNKEIMHGEKFIANYANLDQVSGEIGKKLAVQNISHRWDVEQIDGGTIRVTCILTHVDGHSERTALQAGADTSGSKNNVQAIGSTVSYLERYTLLAATGMSTGDIDDDGGSHVDAPRMSPTERQKAGLWHGPLKVTALKNKLRDFDKAMRGCDPSVAQDLIDEYDEVLGQAKKDLPEAYYGNGAEIEGAIGAIRSVLPDYELESYEHVDKFGEHVATYHDALQYMQCIFSDASAIDMPAAMVALYEHNEEAIERAGEILAPDAKAQYFDPVVKGYQKSKGAK